MKCKIVPKSLCIGMNKNELNVLITTMECGITLLETVEEEKTANELLDQFKVLLNTCEPC